MKDGADSNFQNRSKSIGEYRFGNAKCKTFEMKHLIFAIDLWIDLSNT